jgi:D-sedoheptulose 7-phosphate isomerase
LKEKIISILRESADLKLKFAQDSLDSVINATNLINKCFKSGGKLLIFGNGGSASDTQHIASEFINRFMLERKALPAISLATDSSVITSIANDFGFENIFARQIEALGKKNDVAIGLTTSGKSVNVLNGLKAAKSLGMTSIVFTGNNFNNLKKLSKCIISVPSESTARIQEVHITVAHIICELAELQAGNIEK